MALLNRFVIHGHAVGLGHEIHAERTILLCMNALGKPSLMQMNTDRLAKAHAEIQKELRGGMAKKAGGHVINHAAGIQRLTMCEFIVTVTCEQSTIPIVCEEEP